jgi:hypothetical protein
MNKNEALQEIKDEALAPVPSIDFGADLDQFKDQFDKTALQIPFLRILDAKSKTCTAGESGYNEDARPGMFLNTVTGDLAKKIEVIPVFHYSTFIEWIPRSEGGGFVKDHGFDEGMRLLSTTTKRVIEGKESNRDQLPNGNDLVRTEVYFVLEVLGNSVREAMLTMTSTQLKKAKNWNSRHRLKVTEVPGKGKVTGAPMFFNTYNLSSQPEKNDFGNWMGYVIEDGRPTLQLGDWAYLEAKRFRETVERGIQSGAISMKGTEEEAPTQENVENAPF